jgi:hypothetical protein
MPDMFNHDGHEHQLILSNASYSDKCSSYDLKGRTFFRCANCEFSLDFKCATLSHTIRYELYEQRFTLRYKDEDNSDNEYYCIFVKKNGIQNIGFIIVNISIFLLIPIAFLVNLHISNVGLVNLKCN